MEDDVHTREKESRPKHWTRGKSFYPIIKGSKCKLIDIIEDKKRSRRWQMRWWMATGNNLYFEVCLFYMEFEISFHLCSIFYGSITNYMASKYKITSCIYIFLYRNFCLFAQKCYIRNQFLNVKVNIITASFDANKWQHLWFGRNNFNILTTHTLSNQIHLTLQWQK